MRRKDEIQQLSSKLSELAEMSLQYINFKDSHTILKDELESLGADNLECSKTPYYDLFHNNLLIYFIMIPLL